MKTQTEKIHFMSAGYCVSIFWQAFGVITLVKKIGGRPF
jgi:hypothetical protein